MKKENGEIICNTCGLSLGFYESTADFHYCTTCSFKPERIEEKRKFFESTKDFTKNKQDFLG